MPDEEMSDEKAERLIERIAAFVTRHGMGTPALILLECMVPLAYVGGELGLYLAAPILDFAGMGQSETFFRTFEKTENIEKLIKRIETTLEEEERLKKERKQKMKSVEIDENAKQDNSRKQ